MTAKKIFHRRTRTTSRSLGLGEIQISLIRKQVQLFSDYEAFKPLSKRNKVNEQYSARLTATNTMAGQTKQLRH